MLLFIISEIMVFGAFFTAYFFIRLVAEGHRWFPFEGFELPVAIAGMNTAILLSSSLTMHWAQLSIKNGNRFGLKAGMLLTSLLGATFLGFQAFEFTLFVNEGLTLKTNLFGSSFFTLTGFHGAHVAAGVLWLWSLFAIDVKRGLGPDDALNVDLSALYWHFVDVVWIVIFALVYLIK